MLILFYSYIITTTTITITIITTTTVLISSISLMDLRILSNGSLQVFEEKTAGIELIECRYGNGGVWFRA